MKRDVIVLKNSKNILLCILSALILLMTACNTSPPLPAETSSVSAALTQPTELSPAAAKASSASPEIPALQSAQAELPEAVNTSESKLLSNTISDLEVHFIDVGQGDAILLKCAGKAMLIDAGDNDKGTLVQSYLQKQDVSRLDYVISTHPDSDHCGGLDVILYKFDCGTIIMPSYDKNTDTYRDVINTMNSKGYRATLPTVGTSYTLGDASFTIIGPASAADDANNNSVALILTHGDKRFLFTGDAEADEESDILNLGIALSCDVYKAGHHGSRTSSDIALLEAASPEYCVISCGEDNSYEHPHAETLNNLRALGIKVFRTDEQGSVVCTSDGKNLIWNCAPSESWKAGENTQNSRQTDNNAQPHTTVEVTPETVSQATYVCNTNTKKFHYPECSSVDEMSEKNKLFVTLMRDEIIAMGYDPCKRCNP